MKKLRAFAFVFVFATIVLSQISATEFAGVAQGKIAVVQGKEAGTKGRIRH